MQGKIALAGGGRREDSRLIDQVFAAWIGRHGKMLYLPLAVRGIEPFESGLEWMTATFAPLDVTDITMWTDLSKHRAGELEFDAVYIGGGNTWLLLAQFLESGFERHLTEYVLGGGAVYGSSAGAVILGRDIRTASHIDPNDVGLAETEGLDLAGGHAVWVHYQPSNDKLIQEYIRKYHQPILAISERSGIVIDQAGMRTVGFEPAFRFDEQGEYQV